MKALYLMACCGVKSVEGFDTQMDIRPGWEVKKLCKQSEEFIKSELRTSCVSYHLAILNERQKPYLGPILEKHGFKVIKKRRNGMGNMLFLYCRNGDPS